MISISEAIRLSLAACQASGMEEVPFAESIGRILANDVVSDVNMPPFDKSSMDGYALRAVDLTEAPVVLDIVGTIAAGEMPSFAIQPGQAAKIMTGAPLPEGADSVQMVEKTTAVAGDKVRILESVSRGRNVAKLGEVMQEGQVAVTAGCLITPAVAGVLAAVGKISVPVHKRPAVAVLVTGDELVEATVKPQAGQIRNSNGHALVSQIRSVGARPIVLGIAKDEVSDLKDKIAAGLEHEVLLISGGVSMGEFDLVEPVLEELGVELLFDKVNIKPGKPTVFGKREASLVFGLPGNPVSASTIFEVLVKPVLRKMMGSKRLHNHTRTAVLKSNFTNVSGRVSYHPAKSYMESAGLSTEVIDSRGSADVVAFAHSNSFIIAEPRAVLAAGRHVEVMLRDEYWQA